jgi:hypothetical protein
MATKRKDETTLEKTEEPSIHDVDTVAGLGSPEPGREFVVEIEAPGGKWLRVTGVSYKLLADALREKLEGEGHRVRIREAPADYGTDEQE